MKQKKTKLLFSVLAVTLVGVGAAGGFLSLKAGAEVGWTDATVEREYEYGETLEIPTRSVTVNGKTAEAVSVVEYPNGKTTKSDEITLNVGGRYKIRYTAVVGAKSYEKTEVFDVKSNVVTIGDSRSAYYYGSYTYERKIWDGKDGVYMDGAQSYTCQPGLMVRLAEGDTLTFNEPISVANVTMDDILVTAYATPDVQGLADFEKLIFTFTDVTNPNVYLRVSAAHTPRGPEYSNTYVLAGANNQLLSGINQSGQLEVENNYGTMRGHSFFRRYTADTAYREQDTDPISFSFDTESKRVYATKQYVVDLDESQYFDHLWKGFESGYARLSVTADKYTGTSANFCISQVRGLYLNLDKYVDTVAPVINIEKNYDEVPFASVGYQYPVPNATATDLDSGEREVSVSVWYNYASANATLVQVKDGFFTTDKIGEYTIEYKATDASGNEAVEVIRVTAKNDLPKMQINLGNDQKTQAVCGEFVPVADFEVVDYIGTAKDLKISVTARINNEVIDAKEGFRPTKEGEYTVVYEATDYIQRTVRVEYKVTVARGTVPLFESEAEIPFAFVSGEEYVLPELQISDYTSGSVQRRKVPAKVTDSTGTKTVQAGGTFTPVVTENEETVTVTYFEGNVEKTYVVPTVLAMLRNPNNNRNELQLENFFFKDGILYEQEQSFARIVAGKKDASWTFARALIADGFSLEYVGIASRSQFTGLTVQIRDEQNEEQALSLISVGENNATWFYLGDEKVKVMKSLQGGATFNISYDNGEFNVGGLYLNATKYDNGKEFKGFTSGKIVLTVRFNDATIGAAYQLTMVDVQGITNANTDRFAPRVNVKGSYGGVQKIGTEITLPSAVCADVLDPNIEFYVTIKRPDLQPATDVNGTVLDKVDPTKEYTVLLDSYGQYSVEYYAKDTAGRGNETKFTYGLNVFDENPPTVEFLTELPETAKVGDTIVFPLTSITDDCTAEENIYVMKTVVTPVGTIYTFTDDSNAIVLAQEGVYTFKVFAFDEQMNITVVSRSITVTKA